MPNLIDVGGLTVESSTKQLPSDLDAFITSAEKGVILVTFGTMASIFPAEISQKFISAFDRLQLEGYKIIWRFTNKNKVKVSSNVLISEWLPQNDLLAHPKVILFITHGGNNGQMEAIYHGKPIIGFPINGDQPYNVRRMAYKGYGIEMDIHDFTVEDLVKNSIEVITNPSYKERIQLASNIFRNDPQKPAEKAAWWIEHVIKFGGDHLRSAGNDLEWYQYLMFDILGIFCLAVFVTMFCLLKIVGCIARLCYRRASTTDKQKLN